MKKLDKLILQQFLSPFILTFLVAVFILLLQYMLKYFDDFVGKNLGFGVFAELMLYFSVNMMPMALPLAVLLSSLMTFGNLGQHFELTAIKSAGISLIRIMVPIFVFVICLSIGAFFFNNRVVPAANLKAYSLLYDIKQTKASLDLRAGQFYDGLPGYSIRVKYKYPDGVAMKDVLIYDHSGSSSGNLKVISSDSCRMYTFIDDRYLMMELYNGNHYIEDDKNGTLKNKKKKTKEDVNINRFIRTKFDRMDLVFSLASFDLDRSDDKLFAGNRYMKSVGKLKESIDSMRTERNSAQFSLMKNLSTSYKYNLGGYVAPSETFVRDYDQMKKKEVLDTIEVTDENDELDLETEEGIKRAKLRSQSLSRHPKEEVLEFIENKSVQKARKDSMYLAAVTRDGVDASLSEKLSDRYLRQEAVKNATEEARKIKASIGTSLSKMENFRKSIDAHVVEKFKKYAQAFSCIVMFLIGAPLGAIIKKGGLGFPVVISVFFFVIFYVVTSVMDKWAKAGRIEGFYAAWMANFVLFPPGLIFLKQARKDARLFDPDFYLIWIDKAQKWWEERQKSKRKA
ncbi:LptF/LptG family permease [Reichenbachiella versicolor]|uniref:LptF/LptG family permease n=1 Tax=Reichenbachiella versicolor TaxID=1821036 RepID=UPI000D6E5917|nr:LptF/LptG family permease [Reichenbachiella versicolor]